VNGLVSFQGAAVLAGGLGLFLLGMAMMTDGLKLAAGPALARILEGATRTRQHALGSGMLLTALVQSSSAVTVATVGFVNAGLLSLGGAIWVLFGANVGTTLTSWIVALVGLKLDIETLALPLIAVGAVLRMTSLQQRAAVGQACAGFGLLFLGIDFLQQAMAGVAGRLSPPQGDGVPALLAQLGIGALMTMLVQSSSTGRACRPRRAGTSHGCCAGSATTRPHWSRHCWRTRWRRQRRATSLRRSGQVSGAPPQPCSTASIQATCAPAAGRWTRWSRPTKASSRRC
jgi:hypothetical protein